MMAALSAVLSSCSALKASMHLALKVRSCGLDIRITCMVMVDAPDTSLREEMFWQIARANAIASTPLCDQNLLSSVATVAFTSEFETSSRLTGIRQLSVRSTRHAIVPPFRSSKRVEASPLAAAICSSGKGNVCHKIASRAKPNTTKTTRNADAHFTKRLIILFLMNLIVLSIRFLVR